MHGYIDNLESRELRQLQVNIISPDVCKKPDLWGSRIDEELHLCVGEKPTSCGDGGGPLQCRAADGRWKLAGVTSFDISPKAPGVYTKIAPHLDWIKKYVKGT